MKKIIQIDEDKIKNLFKEDLNLVIFYNENFKLNFEKIINSENSFQAIQDNKIIFNSNDPIIINNKDNIKYYYLILYEAKIFKKLFYTINTDNREELATCAIGLYISLYILNLLTKKDKKKEDDDKEDESLNENINTFFKKLFSLFTHTQCFYGKYNFLSILIYLILISYIPLKIEYIERFIYSLEELKTVPSIIIFLLYNNNIEFNLYNNNIKEKFVENKIYYLEKKKHEHKFDLESLAGEFKCEKVECQEYMWFEVVNNIKNKKHIENVLKPIYLIEKLLNKIEDNNSIIIPDIADLNDIEQIAFLDDIYFKLRFFREDIMDEIEY